MGSVIQFQDLNLAPEPPVSASSSALGATKLVVPKIEPKTEPVDEWPSAASSYQTPQPPPPPPPPPPPHLFSYSAPAFFPNTQTTPPLESSSSVTADENVLSEFNRVAELFRSAFAERLKQRYDDVSVLDSETGAIVPAASEETSLAVNDESRFSSFVVSRRHKPQRSEELVRVSDMKTGDQRYFRVLVKQTRMIYDSLRIYLMMEEIRKYGVSRKPRGDLRASALMRDRGLWMNNEKRIVGSIPGVQIGDLFFFRMELCVVGLHGQPQAGIDYLPASRSNSGEPIATSIIVSGGYEDDEDVGDVIIYTGHGGQDKLHRQCQHQKLEGGNLAMERSMYYGIEVRVIRGFKYENSVSSKVYVYDGLYKILDCWFDVGKSGFGVFKFKLMRIEGQPEMGSSMVKFAQMLKNRPLTVRPTGYLSFDISNNRENVPISLFNDIDGDQEPLFYEYIVKSVFPPFAFGQGGHESGCTCVANCNDNCFCVMKNGGEFAYDYNGYLLRGKSVIFECGSFCKCPPSCRNRLTQRGLKYRLEVFRSRETGWGVRSLDIIPAGSFICEYAGVVLTREQAEILSMNGDTLVHPGRFSEKWEQWGDLSRIFSNYVKPTYPSTPPLDFAMDVSRMRNVACYMGHSTAPNVLVQFVLYDHNNLMFPHVMLFAMENIPPLVDLTIDYGVADEWNGKLVICN